MRPPLRRPLGTTTTNGTTALNETPTGKTAAAANGAPPANGTAPANGIAPVNGLARASATDGLSSTDELSSTASAEVGSGAGASVLRSVEPAADPQVRPEPRPADLTAAKRNPAETAVPELLESAGRADDEPRRGRDVLRRPIAMPTHAHDASGEPRPTIAVRSAETAPLDGDRGATGPQLRRFIKSRAYVPMHELRRRFAINSGDDDVTPVDLERSRVYVGLPEREGRLLGELLKGGDIGYELSMDPISPIVVGVYPMRPITRG